MSTQILNETIDGVLQRIKWKFDEFTKKPNYEAVTHRPYQTIDDWLNEFTGDMIQDFGEWREETYGDILPSIILNVILRDPPLSLYFADNVDTRYLALEVEREIQDLPISKLTQF